MRRKLSAIGYQLSVTSYELPVNSLDWQLATGNWKRGVGTICVLAALLLAPGRAAAQSHLLIVSGLGGEPRWSDELHRWGVAMVDAASKRYGLGQDQIIYLAEKPERDPARIDGKSTREEIEKAVAGLAGRAGSADRILIVLMGHGASDSQGARLNLSGPDLTAADLARLLERFPTQRVVVVNTASASGDFQEPLAARNRTVITATKSGMERNETVFGKFFVDAFAGTGADTDKDGKTSVLEAFEYAQREVERHYTSSNHLQTEHALLSGDREAARAFFLAAAPSLPAGASAELRALLEQKQQLEARVEAHRARKDQMEAAQYQKELEQLLVELALKNREIRAKEGK